ncbi:MAG: hypothetical protein C5B59_18105 [Bacteroidetes bacterium]|nr:MAG: hypothetical protein C5B59_18105 [Bacteroidota bacterium]
MSKKFVPVVLFSTLSMLSISSSTQAQRLFFIFMHGQYAIPVDSYFYHNYNYGLGVEGGAGIGAGRTFFVATVGYTSFSSVSNSKYGNTSFVPIKGGIRHYLPGKLLFISADMGIAHVNNNLVNSSRFSGDIGLGVRLGPFEAMAAYDGYARTSAENSGYSSWIGLKAGFHFGL